MSTQRLATLFVGAALLGTAALPAHAALITFSDRGLFNVAAPGLTVETFETGLVNAAGITVCNGPLSSNATSACFASVPWLLASRIPPHPDRASCCWERGFRRPGIPAEFWDRMPSRTV